MHTNLIVTQWPFSTEGRMRDKAVNPFLPEPTQIKITNAMGKQQDSRRVNAPMSSISGRQSFGANVKTSYGPGPAAYPGTSSFGAQLLSTKKR